MATVAIGATGFAIAILQARSILTDIEKRINDYRKAPATFQTLKDKVARLARHIDEVESLLEKFPDAVPSEISSTFNDTFAELGGTLESARMTMEESFSVAFEGSSSCTGKLKSKSVRIFRATKLKNGLAAVETKINSASKRIFQLALALGSVIKIQEHRGSTKDIFRRTTNTPALTDLFKLDFDAKDAEGRPATHEAVLKQSLLSSDSSRSITAAVGVLKPAYGIVGMAGVGKTVALRGLAYDKDVQTRFPDGVLYMTLGQGATVETVLRELSNILFVTGADSILATVKASTTLHEAVDAAVQWFQGHVCLFLVDDLWPTKACRTGFLSDIRQLLRHSPASRMAISTRSTDIAECAGAVVRFGALEPFGSVSVNMFMAHAKRCAFGESFGNAAPTVRNSVQIILGICAGLPIALAVTGSAVAKLSNDYGNFDTACDTYAIRLEKKRNKIGHEKAMEGASLNDCILLSLEFLQDEFFKRKVKTDKSIFDLYTSLCVLEHQAWVPISVLRRLWQLDEDEALAVVHLFSDMSLATLRPSSECSSEPGIVLHDLQLDFCQRQASEENKTSLWHAQLLDGYVAASNEPRAEESKAFTAHAVVSFKPRSWWSFSITEEGYIYANTSRHLICAGLGIELAALLLDARWTQVRGKIGGILALKTDFELLQRCFLGMENSTEREWIGEEVRQGFEAIFKAVQLSWGRMVTGLRVFQFQVCGRLASMRKSNVIIDSYLNSIENYTPKPYLVPVNSFFPELNSALIAEIPLGGRCFCVASSPCGRYIAAGAGTDILVARSSTGEILQRLRGHEEDVLCVAFAAGFDKIVSGSEDGKAMMWDWEASESAVHVLEGYGAGVRSIAVNSDGGRVFFCASDGTLRTWDTYTGTETAELSQDNDAKCVAVCGENGMIAVGLRDGLRVLDCETKDVLFQDIEAQECRIACVSFSPNGSYVAAGSEDGTIRVWNAQTWTRVGDAFGESPVTGVAFSPDGKQIASSSIDWTIRLWNVESGACVGMSKISKTTSRIMGVSFTGDGDRIVTANYDVISPSGIVQIWNARLQAEAKEKLHGYSGVVLGVAINGDGTRVASASSDRTVQLWDAYTGDEIGPPLEGHSAQVNCVSFSPDGRRVVSGSSDNTLRLWDSETHTQIGDSFEGHTDHVRCVSFSADGRRVLSGSSDVTVRVWDADTHEQIGEAVLGHSTGVRHASETADGCHIVVLYDNGITIIWKCENRAIVWKSKNIELTSQNDITDEEKHCEADTTGGEDAFENEITNDEAEKIIRSCGQHTPHLWPLSFPAYSSELYCYGEYAYSNLNREKTLIADQLDIPWTYHTDRKIFADCLGSGAVAVCKFITK